MNLDDLRTLLDYHYWARDRALEAAARLTQEQFTREIGSSFPSVHRTLVHTYAAEWVWHARWQGDSPTALVQADQFPDAAVLQSSWIALEKDVRSFVDDLGESGIARRLDYRLFSGQPGSALFWQMVQHVVNHASYHRGQVTTMLRQMEATPPKSMDLITFYRERGTT